MSSAVSPRGIRGALVSIDLITNALTTIVFQYNPETVTRKLEPRIIGGEVGQASHALRFAGAPTEQFDLEVVIDASDQLERGTLENGILPQLSAIEALLYPASQSVEDNANLMSQGLLEIGPYPVPLALFVWGNQRVVPVQVQSVGVREELFDARLNPLRATVTLSLRALTYSDLGADHRGYSLFLTYQKNKEQLARAGVSNNAAEQTGVDINNL